RLDQFLGWCREADLTVQPSLFVGWMSGGVFWPKWKAGRNAFSDSFMRRRAVALAAAAARVCARHGDIVLAMDQGNELCCLPDCSAAAPEEVAAWCAEVNAAIAREFPTALRISGNEQTQVIADSGWRLGAQPGCDLYSMHTYPNSAWHPLRFDGMTDPLGQSLFPFYLKCARAFGPVMAQEFGTLFTAGKEAADYLRAILPACHAAGANGYLWWCLRDIAARVHPYEKNAFEGGMGLVDAAGRVKSALRPFLEFARDVTETPADDVRPPDVALYWPKHYYPRDNPLNPGNEPRVLSRRMIVAHFALEQLGLRVGVERGDLPTGNAGANTIVIAGALLSDSEVRALTGWVRAGGRLVWHGLEATTWGRATDELTGATAVDFLAPRAEGVEAFGETWNFREFARDVRVGVRPTTAWVVAKDRSGRAVVLENRLGRGGVAVCLAQPDDGFADESEDRAARSRWSRWYAGMLKCCGHALPSGIARKEVRAAD
ncbi:MAG TPA: DUF4350 domain-containing protein, partial [Opitutus sp.]|nr:DUF4350 domain-containing protein [Opitutus sp.]